MASVVPTLSASELHQTVEDEGPWYEKIRAGKCLQPEDLARLHLNTKNLLDHVRFLEQNHSRDVPELVIARSELEDFRENVYRPGTSPSSTFLDYTGRLREHIGHLEEEFRPTLLRPPLSRLGVQIAQDDLAKFCSAGAPLTEREQQLYDIAQKLLGQTDCLTEELDRVCSLRHVGLSIQCRKLKESRDTSEGLQQELNDAMSQLMVQVRLQRRMERL